jgi:sporulation protein YlmC with PRC-barrel domain
MKREFLARSGLLFLARFLQLFLLNIYLIKKGGIMKMSGKEYEVDNLTGKNHEGPNANLPVRRLTATSIIGDRVENLDGENLGTIDNLMININSGIIEYVVLESGSFLGLGGKLFAIPFSQLYLNADKECFIMNREKEYFKSVPGFDKNHWPDTNDHSYFNDVDNYWNTSTTAETPRI